MILLPEDELHREHARRRVVLDRRRNEDPREILQVLPQRDEVLRFLPVVELAEDRLAELVHHLLELVQLPRVGMPVEHDGDLGERFEVFDDLLADAGPLHLDGHGAAVPERGAMDLSERRGRERRGFEVGERLGDANAELLTDDPFDLGEGEGLDVVLKPREGFQVGNRKEVRAGRKELPELDERRTEPFEVLRQLQGLRRRVDAPGLRRQVPLDIQPFGEVSPPVLHEQDGDVLVALEVRRFEREGHGLAIRRQLSAVSFQGTRQRGLGPVPRLG